ncbi:glycerol-1-phosphate dehydrogenase [NAD(P)+] [Terribacillus halophilus]|uniref:Glycerol-1-phosphate dehydrogenase [NAD(P)+] n=1 Tax=Terribacillus halophilus TaxID=361279 RepID=A0A1G6QMR6_9BACI|nr:sn-glycerol-1-phosphate dehydrogenase [Terribacillus halophilus]SDC93700.1 glycerol-1-phosphate dehydrogenase [NAD(P)+] [Terribacillus halophilus]
MQLSADMLALAEEFGISQDAFPQLEVESGALAAISTYMEGKSWSRAVLIVDAKTKAAAGDQLAALLQAESIHVHVIELLANHHGQVNADEASLVQVLVETPIDTDVLLAVGAGTIHDITRFCSQKLSIPFVAVPTAASVDGFTSKGAPLILRGVKQTIQTAAPVAVFADLDVLCAAPRPLTAAGFGDILGKFTSLLDWEISAKVGGEPYNALAAKMTRHSLDTCVDHIEEIAKADEAGIRILMEALIESGIVMQILDFSRPASGAEHHLSHYWEMHLLETDKRQLLHGAKVGVACAIIAELYQSWAEQFESSEAHGTYAANLQEHWEEIRLKIAALPTPEALRYYLYQVGAPASAEEIGIQPELVQDSLNEAYHLRTRCTGLFLINQFKNKTISYPLQDRIGSR